METIFTNQQVETPIGSDDVYTYDQKVNLLIEDAVDFEESYLTFWRQDNQAFYDGLKPTLSNRGDDDPTYTGLEDADEEVNRSKFVSTDVRDTILTILPSLIRIFTTNDERVVNLVPNSEDQQELAEQQMDYLNYVFFEDNQGFMMLYSLFKDLMTVKYGVTKWWSDNDVDVIEQTFRNISIDQIVMLQEENDTLEVVEATDYDFDQDNVEEIRVRYTKSTPMTYVDTLPPEEFRISRDAKNVEEAGLVGHERLASVSELVRKGYPLELIQDNLSTQPVYSDERYMRNPGLTEDRPIMGVMYGEYYIRIDKDGDGIDELRYVCTIGGASGGRTIVHDEVVSRARFALWSGDPRPHTAIGDCIADITKDIQLFKSLMMRGQIDNLAEVMNPRSVVNELVTNIEDVLNDEVGAIIRTRGDPGASVAYSRPPYVGAEVQDTIGYLDQVRASRTGITEASKGLDPKAMQSTSLVGIDAIVSGAQERIELLARLIAESGLRATFKGLLREITENPNKARVLQLRGKWVEVDPSTFDPTMKLQVNPTLGKGSDMVRLQALGEIKQTQIMVMEKFGVDNPLVGPIEFRNTLEDMAKIGNIKNISRYFKKIDQDTLDAIKAAPKEPDPTAVLAQAELEKVKKDVIIAGGKAANEAGRLALDREKMIRQDDFNRDKLNIDATIAIAEMLGQGANPTEPPAVASMNQPPAGEE